jgi:thiol-disulfide isomerase/thioredoxin
VYRIGERVTEVFGEKRVFHSVTILFLILSLGVFAGAQADDLFSNTNIKPIKDKRKVPNITLDSLKGGKVELKSFKGKVIFLNFWATWCGPCKEEMPSMEALQQQFKDKDFLFLTISVDYEGAKPVRDFIEKQRYTFPVLIDQKGETLDLFDVKGIPTTFIIDKQATMIGIAIGPQNWKSPEVIKLLNQLTAK